MSQPTPEPIPAHLLERTAPVSGGDPGDGAYVLYWCRTAVRGHENPALDVAVHVANELGVPALVYQAVDERTPFASDRHHRFMLEGARDLATELAERGIAHALHVARPGHRGPHLRSLGRRAALVVTEAFPLDPLRGWTRRLAEAIDCPVWEVDTACVVPPVLVGRGFDRAFRFRDATRALRAERIDRPWRDPVPTVAPASIPLPFVPVDPRSADLSALIAACDIDHSVGPVPDTTGGSVAGYARWRRFVDGGGLDAYARRRNDATDPHGVSRMSAYLHYGHVSPLRLAREAADHGGRGAAKYLDELLIWREMAYCWATFTGDPDSVTALPPWARATLHAHEGDPRPQLPSWEQLARGTTGDPLWDAAQRSLLRHGELHNNVRMTWGKALLSWTPSATEALRLLMDLNHRYALDGRDPASYGGLLWCLGGFDRPFTPEQPILGTVRGRPTADHARRMRLDRFQRHVDRPPVPDPPRTAIVGGGLAGAICARILHDHGLPVEVFDKGRGPGGRTSTRRRDADRWDHGAQYMTARDPTVRRWVEAWAHEGVVAPWAGRLGRVQRGRLEPLSEGPRYVGVPGMSSIVRHLLADVPARFGTRVEGVVRAPSGWTLDGVDGSWDHVVIATPAAQAVPLLTGSPALADPLGAVEAAPCWAVLIRFAHRVALDWDGARLDGRIAWAARDSSKPGRPPGERWVLHASPAWSTSHLEDDPAAVTEALLGAFDELTDLPDVLAVSAHRWRYAQVTRPVGTPCLWDPAGLGACGDGLLGGRAEDALRSGVAMAGRILGSVADRGVEVPAGRPARQLTLL